MIGIWMDDNYLDPYCPEIKSHTNPIISLIMWYVSQKIVNFVGKLRMTLIEPYFDMCG